MAAVAGWHRGELAIQKKLGFDGPSIYGWKMIRAEMSEQHRTFHTTRLPFIPVTSLDERGRPWGSILAGPEGNLGFTSSASFTSLDFHARFWDGDPFLENMRSHQHDGRMLIAGIGIEFSTRRRNKFAGYVYSVERAGDVHEVRSVVNQALGNCPKYINVRTLDPYLQARPRVVYHMPDVSARLPDHLIDFVHASDTVFIGSSYEANEQERQKYPSHVGMNHRGGRPGFVRADRTDGRTLVLPDYSGNRLLSSLGNIEVTSLASLTFVDFANGAILYLTGNAKNYVGPDAQKIMPLQNALTTVEVTGYIYVEDALPVRERPGTKVQRSPYSPPIRLLSTEKKSSMFSTDDGAPEATLRSIEIHSPNLATFTFDSSFQLDIVPGQTAIMDFKSLVGSLPYQHMAEESPEAVNDDRIRTWTISRASSWTRPPSSDEYGANTGDANTFALTMRHKLGGAITGALFNIAHKIAEMKPELLSDSRPLGLRVPLVGIAGEFTLEPSEAHLPVYTKPGTREGTRKLLWLAGGIGITPFLAMLKAIANGSATSKYDIVLAASTREPEVILKLISEAMVDSTNKSNAASDCPRSMLSLHIFSSSPLPSLSPPSFSSHQQTAFKVSIEQHSGRLSGTEDEAMLIDSAEREVYMCGPPEFEDGTLGVLKSAGVESTRVRREGFAY